MDHPDDCKFVIYVHKTDKFVVAILELSCVAVLYLGLLPSRLYINYLAICGTYDIFSHSGTRISRYSYLVS